MCNTSHMLDVYDSVLDYVSIDDIMFRRIYTHYLEQGWSYRETAGTNGGSKKMQYNIWFQQQFAAYKDELIHLITHGEDAFLAVSIRSYIEIINMDDAIAAGPDSITQFPLESYKALLVALTISKKEIDIDLLLMLKEEVFSFHDCTYFALVILKDLIIETKDMYMQSLSMQQITDKATKNGKDSKDSSVDNAFSTPSAASHIVHHFDTIRKNFMDLMRVLVIPDELDAELYMVPLQESSVKMGGGGGQDSDSDGNDSSDDEDYEAKAAEEETKLGTKAKKIDPLLAELAGLNRGTKRGADATTDRKKIKKQRSGLSTMQKLAELDYYQRVFSKAWLALLTFPFSAAQHKLLLRHLPENVIPVLRSPILLADYLAQSYAIGGLVSVLALESLFHLILHYNLDYPDFFRSLYNLCTVEVFSAKYRFKFMKLLNTALKSVNMPVYLVAAFIKRLSHLALHTPTPNAAFCVAQCTWLLRQHPQSQVLIHKRNDASVAPVVDAASKDLGINSGAGTSKEIQTEFNHTEDTNLEDAGALQSSLWELETLQQHHWNKASILAAAIKKPESTMVAGAAAAATSAYVHVEDYLNVNYAELIENGGYMAEREQLVEHGNKPKKNHRKLNASMHYVKPSTLLESNSLVGKLFTVG